MDCRYIVSLTDGRVVPFFPKDDAIPSNYVQVSEELLKKWNDGKFANGLDLAKAALMGDASVGTEKVKESVEKLTDDKAEDANGEARRPSRRHL